MADPQNLQRNVDARVGAIHNDPMLRAALGECLQIQCSAAKEILGNRSADDRIGDLCRATMTFLDGRAERSPLQQQWACRPGCGFCCTARVDVTAPQAIGIAQYLDERLSSDERGDLRRRLSERVRQISKMTAAEHAVAKLPCVFLQDDSTCLIHPVRPAKCATFYSCSAERCREAFARPEDSSIAVPFDLVQAAVGDGVSAGLGLACVELGLDHWTYELHSAVLRAMDLPDAGERWLAGEPVFRSCLTRGADANATVESIREAKAASEGRAGRNAPCPCGSGKKYKKCCMRRSAS